MADETAAVIQEACTIYAETGGAFDITVYPVMDAWGFYSGAPDVPNDATLQNALKNCGCNHLILNGNTIRFAEENMGVDLGGIAKGYASAAVAETLMQNGVESAVISLGGNIHVLGSKPDGTDWSVAIQDPEDATRYIGTVSVSDMAVVTSGSYQRYFEKDGVKYHHILDPKTGCPANTGLRSVTVVSRNDMEADALSTALFVMGMEQAANYWREHGGFEILFVTDKNEVFITAGLSDCFSSSQEYEVIGIEN